MKTIGLCGLLGIVFALGGCGTEAELDGAMAPANQTAQETPVALGSSVEISDGLDNTTLGRLSGVALQVVRPTGLQPKRISVITRQGTATSDILTGSDGRISFIRVSLNGNTILESRFSRNGSRGSGKHVFGAGTWSLDAEGGVVIADNEFPEGTTQAMVLPGIALAKSADADTTNWACVAATAAYAVAVATYGTALAALQSAMAFPPAAPYLYAVVATAGAGVIAASLAMYAVCV